MNQLKSALVIGVAALSFATGISTAYAADTVYSDRKVTGLTIDNTTTGDVTVYAGSKICKIVGQDRAVLRKTSSNYSAILSALTAAYLSNTNVTIHTDDTTCAVLAVRLGKNL